MTERALPKCDHCDKHNIQAKPFRTIYGNTLIMCPTCYSAAEKRKAEMILQEVGDRDASAHSVIADRLMQIYEVDRATALHDAANVLGVLLRWKPTDEAIARAAVIHGDTAWSAADDSFFASVFRAMLQA